MATSNSKMPRQSEPYDPNALGGYGTPDSATGTKAAPRFHELDALRFAAICFPDMCVMDEGNADVVRPLSYSDWEDVGIYGYVYDYTASSQSEGIGSASSRMAQWSAVLSWWRWTVLTSGAPLDGESPARAAK